MEIYGKEASWWGEYMGQYKEVLRYARGAKVLDVGCGRGFGSRMLFDNGAIEVLGIDINEFDIHIAKEKNGRDGVEFKIMSVADMPLITERFDLITCFQVLERVASPDRLIQNMSKLLAPQGVAVISTVNRSRFSKLNDAPADPTHIAEFNYDELQGILRRSFSPVEISNFTCTRADMNMLEKVSQKVMGKNSFPTENDYALKNTQVADGSLFYAVCKKA